MVGGALRRSGQIGNTAIGRGSAAVRRLNTRHGNAPTKKCGWRTALERRLLGISCWLLGERRRTTDGRRSDSRTVGRWSVIRGPWSVDNQTVGGEFLPLINADGRQSGISETDLGTEATTRRSRNQSNGVEGAVVLPTKHTKRHETSNLSQRPQSTIGVHGERLGGLGKSGFACRANIAVGFTLIRGSVPSCRPLRPLWQNPFSGWSFDHGWARIKPTGRSDWNFDRNLRRERGIFSRR
jgi:hypothetical protein